ncbi:unnamed protein product [Urochloa humidicola]
MNHIQQKLSRNIGSELPDDNNHDTMCPIDQVDKEMEEMCNMRNLPTNTSSAYCGYSSDSSFDPNDYANTQISVGNTDYIGLIELPMKFMPPDRPYPNGINYQVANYRLILPQLFA